MFNAQKSPQGKAPKKQMSARDASAVTILTSGCHFSGKLFCRGSSRIGGRIEGQIVSEGLLIIEEEALITAEIRAEEVIIHGSVQGKVLASGRVELTASANVDGDISSPLLTVREGARFNGSASMPRREEAAVVQQKTPRIVAMNGKGKVEDLHPGLDRDAKLEGTVLKTPDINVPAL